MIWRDLPDQSIVRYTLNGGWSLEMYKWGERLLCSDGWNAAQRGQLNPKRHSNLRNAYRYGSNMYVDSEMDRLLQGETVGEGMYRTTNHLWMDIAELCNARPVTMTVLATRGSKRSVGDQTITRPFGFWDWITDRAEIENLPRDGEREAYTRTVGFVLNGVLNDEYKVLTVNRTQNNTWPHPKKAGDWIIFKPWFKPDPNAVLDEHYSHQQEYDWRTGTVSEVDITYYTLRN